MMKEINQFVIGNEDGEKRKWKEELEEKVLGVHNRHLRTKVLEAEDALSAIGKNGIFPQTVGENCLAAVTSIDGALSVVLMRDNEFVNIWNVKYDQRFDPEIGQVTRDINGIAILPDGSVIVNYEPFHELARIDSSGQPIWVRDDILTHHSINLTERNTLWVPGRIVLKSPRKMQPPGAEEDVLYEIDSDTGSTVRTIFTSDILYENSLHGIHRSLLKFKDKLHVNEVEEIGKPFALANPSLSLLATDLIVNAKRINLIFIFDPEGGKVKYARHYPWNQPHDIDPLEDGQFLLFDNNMGIGSSEFSGASRILSVSPDDDDVEVLFKAEWFYSATRSDQEKHGENILVSSDNPGYIFNLYNGEINFWMTLPYDEKRNIMLTDAQWIAPEFFHDPELQNRCSGKQ